MIISYFKSYFTPFFVVCVFISGCGKDKTPVPPPVIELKIVSFSPETGYPGNEVTITGDGFNPEKDKNMVSFNGASSIVKIATAKELLVTVPDSITTGKISVTVNGKTVFSVKDFIRPLLRTPEITFFSPYYGRAGDKVAIYGKNFTEAFNTVRFNGLKAVITNSSPAVILVKVPDGVTDGKISVNVMGEVVTSARNFVVLPLVTAVVSTFAGSGVQGHVNGAANIAQFDFPGDIKMDAAGNLYFIDGQDNKSIRKVTPQGIASTIINLAPYENASRLAVSNSGIIYISDGINHTIKKVSTSGTISVFAGNYGRAGFIDGNGGTARFNKPNGLVLDEEGNLYVSDTQNSAIRKITPNGEVTTAYGNNVNSLVVRPFALVRDLLGNFYVSDADRIIKIERNGKESFIAGGSPGLAREGIGNEVSFYSAIGLTIDKKGVIYVADGNTNHILRVSSDGLVYVIAGNGNFGYLDGPSLQAEFSQPHGVVADENGNIFVTEGNSRIRKIAF